MRTEITLRLPPDCWSFIQEMRATSVPIRLPADVGAILDELLRIELRPPIPQPRFVLIMSRQQGEALHRWLHALMDLIPADDFRWLTCLQCIGRVSGALSLAEP